MKEKIEENINAPAELEKLYRQDKNAFKQAFGDTYTSHQKTPILDFWNTRLNYKEEETSLLFKKEFGLTVVLIFFAGLMANISNLKGIDQELFFTRNTSFIIIPFIAAYFLWKQNTKLNRKLFIGLLFSVAALFINFLPQMQTSSSINLIYIHLPIFLWCILGYAYLGKEYTNHQKRIGFLKYNGDLLVICVILFLAGMLFSALTIGLFELIGLKIGAFYFSYIGIWGIGAIPILGTYLIDRNPQIINKITPIIAKIFTPLAFINLTIYLVVLISKGKYPHQDRNLLLIYNALLVGVLALIFFSVAEIENNKKGYYQTVLLLSLSILTIIINCIALSAISFRIFEYGITPNRIAVLGSNLIVFFNLFMVAIQLLKAVKNNSDIELVQNSIAKYLPVYAIWVGIVAFIIPLLFSFK